MALSFREIDDVFASFDDEAPKANGMAALSRNGRR